MRRSRCTRWWSRCQPIPHAPKKSPATFARTSSGWARQQPGFVSGQWLRGADGRGGMGVVVFASEDAATSAAQGPRNYPRDEDRAWNIENVTVYEQLTSA